MDAAYQSSDFEIAELGDLSVDAFVDQIRSKDWSRDLKVLAGRMLAEADYCEPNFNAQVDDRTTVMIVPSENEQFTIAIHRRTGWKWFATEKTSRFLEASIDDVRFVLAELSRGNYEDLLRNYAE